MKTQVLCVYRFWWPCRGWFWRPTQLCSSKCKFILFTKVFFEFCCYQETTGRAPDTPTWTASVSLLGSTKEYHSGSQDMSLEMSSRQKAKDMPGRKIDLWLQKLKALRLRSLHRQWRASKTRKFWHRLQHGRTTKQAKWARPITPRQIL